MTREPDAAPGEVPTGRGPGPESSPTPEAPVDERAGGDQLGAVNLFELTSMFLDHWRVVLGFPLVAAVAAGVLSFVVPPRYTATASFVPETGNPGVALPGGLVSLATQLGVTVPGGGSNSPEFYGDVVRSRTLVDGLLLTRYEDPRTAAPGDSAVLLSLLGIAGDSDPERLERGREKLGDAISVTVDRSTAIVSVSVETRYSATSSQVANRIIERLNRFNLETRQSNARERRQFIETRLSAAERELREAEEEMKRFLERNRQFRGSPELTFEYERLQRQVLIKQQVYTTLAESYEQARVQEVNDAPVITVIDRAVPPQEPSSPRPLLNTAGGLLLGGVAGVLWVFGGEVVSRARVRDERDYQKLAARWARFRTELRSIFRRKPAS